MAAQTGRRDKLQRLASERWRPAHSGPPSTGQTAARNIQAGRSA